MRVRRSAAKDVNRVYVHHPVDARALVTVEESHPMWRDGAVPPEFTGVAAVRLYPPEGSPESLVRRLVAELRERGVAVKLMPRERVAVDPAVVEQVTGAKPEETVREAVAACVEDMSGRVKLARCSWVEVKELLDVQLGKAGL